MVIKKWKVDDRPSIMKWIFQCYNLDKSGKPKDTEIVSVFADNEKDARRQVRSLLKYDVYLLIRVEVYTLKKIEWKV